MGKSGITEKELSRALNALGIDSRLGRADFEVAADIFHRVEQDKKIIQIEVSPTYITAGHDEGTILKNGEKNTHWSVYVRRATGVGELNVNYALERGVPVMDQLAMDKALARAAALSIEHKVPVVWNYAQ